MRHVILGIDPSLSCTSLVGASSDPDFHYLRQIRTEPKNYTSMPQRIDHMKEQLVEVLDELFPTLALIEGYSYSSKGAGIYQIAEWGGILRHTLWKSGVRFVEIPPVTLKAYVTGKATAQKQLMLREVYRRWKFEAVDDNDADAYSLARLGVEMVGEERTKKVQEIMSKYRIILPEGECEPIVVPQPAKRGKKK